MGRAKPTRKVDRMTHDGFSSIPLDPDGIARRAEKSRQDAALTAEQRMERALRDRAQQRADHARRTLGLKPL